MGFKLLTLITALGLGIIGLVTWVWFASYPGGVVPVRILARATAAATVCVLRATAARGLFNRTAMSSG